MTAFYSDGFLTHAEELCGLPSKFTVDGDYLPSVPSEEESDFVPEDMLCYANERFHCSMHLNREESPITKQETIFWNQIVFDIEPELSFFQKVIRGIKDWWSWHSNPLCTKKKMKVWCHLAGNN